MWDAGTHVNANMPACTHKIWDVQMRADCEDLQKQIIMSLFFIKIYLKLGAGGGEAAWHAIASSGETCFHTPLGNSNQPVTQILIK